MGSKYTKRYSEEFKQDAVALVASSGRTVTEVARELGVSSESLRGRVKKANGVGQATAGAPMPSGNGLDPAEREELKGLKGGVQRREQVPVLLGPRYLLRGPAMGLPASGPGMTFSPCRTHDPGGGVTGPGGIDRPLIRGMTTGFFAGREALRNVDVADRCRGDGRAGT